MEIANLVLDYLKVLIWPLVLVATVLWFRSDVSALIRRMRSLSGPGIDAEFSEEVAEVSAGAEEAVREATPPSANIELPAPAPPPPSSNPPGWDISTLPYIARLSPQAGMLAAWREVEASLYEVAPGGGPESNVVRPAQRLIDALTDVPEDIKLSLTQLRRLRNEVAHGRGSTVSPDAAVEYVQSCAAMVQWLQGFRLGRQSGAS
ncbi:hypothetical protein [Streptomyces lavendulae]|uniref:hypothetical protein n=1 Tax=Streptomyces lavendulae TaxID=1914 RepID=UPI0024A40F64|nr:hypothetical protein [Streptomyces lavendulae]GLW04338.1 hypothetical protein Slala05_79680 [Streptomyces lavendulae subsp. lavendulae]